MKKDTSKKPLSSSFVLLYLVIAVGGILYEVYQILFVEIYIGFRTFFEVFIIYFAIKALIENNKVLKKVKQGKI